MRPWNVKRLFRYPFRTRDAVRSEIAEEFAFHLDMRTDELTREGMNPADARRQAVREFGNHTDGVQACAHTGDRLERRRRLESALDELRQDVRMGLRLLGRSPGFATVAILTLALGIGANTAIYSVLDSLLLRPLPYPESDRLVHIAETLDSGRPNSVSGGAFLDWRTHATQFDAIALTGQVAYNLRGVTTTERLSGLEVSHEFFRVLRVPMLHGRGFRPEEDRPGGATDVVVITEELWRTRFGADPSMVGRVLVLDEVPRTVIGVLPLHPQGLGRCSTPSPKRSPLVLLRGLAGTSRSPSRGPRPAAGLSDIFSSRTHSRPLSAAHRCLSSRRVESSRELRSSRGVGFSRRDGWTGAGRSRAGSADDRAGGEGASGRNRVGCTRVDRVCSGRPGCNRPGSRWRRAFARGPTRREGRLDTE
jgi:hypothetical protein